MGRTRAVAAVLSVVLAAAGCSKVGGTPGGADPQDCFARLKEAQAKKDWGGLYDQMSTETKQTMLGSILLFPMMAMAMGGTEQEKMKPLKEIFARHGLPTEPTKGEPPGGPDAGAKRLEKVADRRALFVDVFGWVASQPDFNMDELVELQDVKVEGDRATATAFTAAGKPPDRKRKSETWKFKREGGRWFADMGATPK